MATYCRHPYIQLRARSSVSLRSGGSILQSKAGPFLASGEGDAHVEALFDGNAGVDKHDGARILALCFRKSQKS